MKEARVIKYNDGAKFCQENSNKYYKKNSNSNFLFLFVLRKIIYLFLRLNTF